jgi:D-alanine transfer protein
MSAPPSPDGTRRPRFHLVAGALSLCVLCAVLVGGAWWADALERASFPAIVSGFTTPQTEREPASSRAKSLEHLKNQGRVLQQLAFRRADQLPLYGSSELMKHIPNKAAYFFHGSPTGFSVFPVGKAGSASFIILQRLAALGKVTRDRPVAISVSPSWFTVSDPEGHYAGNVSPQQELAALLNQELSYSFRCDLARRLLMHPVGVEHDPLLRFLCIHMARGGWIDRATYDGAWPLAKLRETVYTLQDHVESCLYIRRHTRAVHHPRHRAVPFDWDRLIAEASAKSQYPKQGPPVPKDYWRKMELTRSYLSGDAQSPEWANFEFLVRGLQELHLHALILCIPPNGFLLERGGVSKESLTLFMDRIRAIGARYGVAMVTFDDHMEDFDFRADATDHLSNKGWLYFDRALDEFYHAPALPQGATP